MQTDTDIKLSRTQIETLPNYRKQTANEYSAACPVCGGKDRFRFWPEDGNYWCRQCELKGFVADGIQIDPATLDEWRRKEAERKAIEQSEVAGKLDIINRQNNVTRYHGQLTDHSRQWWHDKGLSIASIKRWQLGYTSNCPTAPGEASYTIPIFYQSRLYNIRHRLVNGNNGNKYRPELAGLPAAIFNADVLLDYFINEVVIVEGEIKAMILTQNGFDAIGIPGANVFKPKWVNLFKNAGKLVYVALDPGAAKQAISICQMLGVAGVEARICTFPVKPDDFFVLYGGSKLDFYSYLMLAERVS